MDRSLIHAAQTGHIADLYASFRRDPYLFETIDALPFTDTPLHVSVLAKQTRFAKEVASLKPSFIRKLNQDGHSPVHLASTNGLVEMVKEFLKIDAGVGILRGRDKKTPLHCAAVAGKVGVLNEILKACPQSLLELTVQDETALHLAVKHDQFEAFKVLLKASMSIQDDILNWKDDEGNALLHLAAPKKNRQMIEELLSAKNLNGLPVMELNARNANNQTAVDIILQLPRTPETRGIEDALRGAPTVSLSSHDIDLQAPPGPNWATHYPPPPPPSIVNQDSNTDVKNSLLVVAVLIATATLQTGVVPPGGIWQENSDMSPISAPSSESPHKAGMAILATWPDRYALFMFFNFVRFMLYMVMISILTKGFPLYWKLQLALMSMIGTYTCSVGYITPENCQIYLIIVFAGIAAGLVLSRSSWGAAVKRLWKKWFTR